jgi:hypothetical protein
MDRPVEENTLRPLAAALGLGTLAFGILPMLAPRRFARLFGIAAPDLAVTSMMRSLGVRDGVMGIGLWSAATHGGQYAPWLLARLLIDAGDTAAVALAVAAGVRHPRFLALGGLALGATAVDAVLYWGTRRLAAAPRA